MAQDKRHRAEQVRGRRDHRDAVVVGVEAEAVGRDRAVVADEVRQRSWRGARRAGPCRSSCTTLGPSSRQQRRDDLGRRRRAPRRSRSRARRRAVTSSTMPAPHAAPGLDEAEVQLGREPRRRGCRRASPTATAAAGSRRAAPGSASNDVEPALDREPGEHARRRRRATSTGTDSSTMRRSIGRCVRQPTTSTRCARARRATASTGVTPAMPTSAVARNRLGSVTESAAAVTTGAATLSRSHSWRTLSAATRDVITMTTTTG